MPWMALMKRKATHLAPSRAPFSCALQKIAAVPTRHPCRNVTKTNILIVFQRLSSSARGARMG